MPHFEVADGAVEVIVEALVESSPDNMIYASEDVGFVSVCIGSDEGAVLVHIHGGARDGEDYVRPGGRIPVARAELLTCLFLINNPTEDIGSSEVGQEDIVADISIAKCVGKFKDSSLAS